MGPNDYNQVMAILRKMDNRMNAFAQEVESVKVQGGLPASMPGQYPGKPIPTTEGVEIDIGANTTRVMGNIVFSADGPFLAKSIPFCFRPTGGQNAVGMWRPISSSRSPDVGNDDDVINFYWEYQVTGSHRNRSNTAVPSAIPHQAEGGNGYFDLAVEDTFEATSTVSVWINPSVAPANAGVMYIGFHGAYLLK